MNELYFHYWSNPNRSKDTIWFHREVWLRSQLYFQMFSIFQRNPFVDVSLFELNYLLKKNIEMNFVNENFFCFNLLAPVPVIVVVVDEESWLSSAVWSEFCEIVSPEPIVERFFDPPDFFESLFFLKIRFHSGKNDETLMSHVATFILLNKSTVLSVCFCKTSAWAHVSHLKWKSTYKVELFLLILLFVPTVVMNVVLPFVFFFIDFHFENLNAKYSLKKKKNVSSRFDWLWLCKFCLDAKRKRVRLEENFFRFSSHKKSSRRNDVLRVNSGLAVIVWNQKRSRRNFLKRIFQFSSFSKCFFFRCSFEFYCDLVFDFFLF